ncbi:hypothetical protein FRB94_008541 [Tulasnella sp. JGI-2019a]|nr:hypothetical protein FRB94_008541 [Tulasnella sp. JGI-2019a]KAG9009226.1 hypothetical protein FRB93_005722 [Tulasnella sp. JGI-2019a]
MADRSDSLTNYPARVSFTVRRPSPLSSRQSSIGPESDSVASTGFKVPPPRLGSGNSSGVSSPLRNGIQGNSTPANGSRLVYSNGAAEESGSSGEDDSGADELVSGFDAMGVQRVKAPAKKPTGPLVIPLAANRDWRAIARARQAARGYIPDGARAGAGADGSQGGLGTKDSINSGPQLAGLIIKKEEETNIIPEEGMIDVSPVKKEEIEDVEMAVTTEADQPMDEDAAALQAILKGALGLPSVPQSELPAILTPSLDEAEALQRDVAELPEQSTLDDYARVPVEQFGAAMLRGMGWKPPPKGEDEPWVPSKRPALLGIGAKPKAVPADSNAGKGGSSGSKPGWMKRTEEKRYVPLVKKEREKGDAGAGRSSTSRRTSRSRSPPPPSGNRDAIRRRSPESASSSSRRDRERDVEKGRDGEGRERDRDRGKRDHSSSARRDKDDEYYRRRHDRDDGYSSRRDSDRGSSRRDRDR